MQMVNEELYQQKLMACWHGKNIGGTLGEPYEGFPQINHLAFYDPVPKEAMPNDDLELQAMYAAALLKMEKPTADREALAGIWERHMNFHVDEYAVAMRNLALGIRPPFSGRFDNHFTCGMGAAIRSELWACLAPGDAERAAAWAYEDACIDHDGDGIWAEVFFAVMEALAFREPDVRRLIQAGLNYIPGDGILAQGISAAVELWDQSGDWVTVRNALFERFANECKSDVRINVPFTVLALLAGNGDFGKTICTAVNCGMDTDCTAATAGALLGLLNPDCISDEWLAPVGDKMIVRPSAISGLRCAGTIQEFSAQISELRRCISAPVSKTKTVAAPDFEAYKITGEVAFQHNLSWYCVCPAKLSWEKRQFLPINGRLEVPEEFRGDGGQVVLRFSFRIEREGEYTIMFNSPTSNQVYLDPQQAELHDDRDMLFGRQRIMVDGPRPGDGQFACLERMLIFSPTLFGAPLNQYKRFIRLTPGIHTLIIALEPVKCEKEIYWGMAVGQGAPEMILPEAFYNNRPSDSYHKTTENHGMERKTIMKKVQKFSLIELLVGTYLSCMLF